MSETVLDISHWQQGLDVARLPSIGVAGIIAKSSEGAYSTDGSFASNTAAGHRSGLLVGAYHFARPSQSSGSSQARRLATLCADHGATLAALDIETTGGLGASSLRAWCADFLGTLKVEHTGAVVSYCSESYAYAMEQTLFADGIGRWIAYPTNTPPRIAFDLWQRWWYMSVLGVHPVDGNVWPGELSSLRRWFGVSEATAKPTTPQPIPVPVSPPAAPVVIPPKEGPTMILIDHDGSVYSWTGGGDKGSLLQHTNPTRVHALEKMGVPHVTEKDADHAAFEPVVKAILALKKG